MNLDLPFNYEKSEKPSFFKRVLAVVIDLLLIDIFMLGFFENKIQEAFAGAGTKNIIALINQDSSLMSALLIINGVVATLIIAYFSIMEYYLGYTPGKYILGLRVIKDSDKKTKRYETPELGQCIIRSLGTIFFFPFIFIAPFDIVNIFLDPKKQRRFLEVISKTRTIERKR